MRVYLDNCCYNRPFDDQAQLTVRLETVTNVFLTTDRGILKKVSALGGMKIMNPVQFITEDCNDRN